MKIDGELLTRIEALSKLKLNGSQQERFKNEINEIVNYADKLSAITADGGNELCAQVKSAALRPDEVTIFSQPEELLENAETTVDGCFAVPKAFE